MNRVMYQIIHFDKRLCHFLGGSFDHYGGGCRIYSIWDFFPNAIWKALNAFFREGPVCRAEWFPILYWMVLAISVLGSCYSLLEFVGLYRGSRKRVSIWRQRKYYVLPYTVLRKCRLIGSLVMFNAWLLLFYAVANVSPSHMTPWITINLIVLSFELIIWIIEILFGVTKLNLHHLLTFALPITNFVFVCCVRSVFQRAIEVNQVDDLRLWKNTLK